MSVSKEQIEHFLHGQIEAWNAHDKAAFFGLYKAMSPHGLTIDYVGQPPREAWEILETMWAQQNDKITIEVAKTIINGTEAACHHLNKVNGADFAIETIELYAFGDGVLSVRYFIAN
jgi:hypothetical protein